MGGVCSGADVLDFVAAGASCVALGTILFSDPWAPHRIRTELDETAVSVGKAEGVRRDSASPTKLSSG
jgi:dihydroorotate dehydrogenase (NAD+) catalytic subunit